MCLDFFELYFVTLIVKQNETKINVVKLDGNTGEHERRRVDHESLLGVNVTVARANRDE